MVAVHAERVGGTGQDGAVVAEIGFCGDGGREGMKDGGKQVSHCWRRELHMGKGGKEKESVVELELLGELMICLHVQSETATHTDLSVSAEKAREQGPQQRHTGAL